MQPISLDSIDAALLAAIKAHRGQCIADILREFKLRCASASYTRIEQLADAGLVELDRTSQKGRVVCHLTESGLKALEEVA